MITEKFSADERRRLRKMLARYGAIKECCNQTGLLRTTISRVLKTRAATDEVIIKLRDYMDGFMSRMFVEQAA